MQTTQRNHALLDNYAVESRVTCAEYPAVYERNHYAMQGALAILLVAATIMNAFVMS